MRRAGQQARHRAILDELLRVGAADRTEDGKVRLLARAYIPVAGDEEKLEILGADVSFLIGTIDHNLRAEPGKTFFQRKTMYDNLPDDERRELTAQYTAQDTTLIESVLAELDRRQSR